MSTRAVSTPSGWVRAAHATVVVLATICSVGAALFIAFAVSLGGLLGQRLSEIEEQAIDTALAMAFVLLVSGITLTATAARRARARVTALAAGGLLAVAGLVVALGDAAIRAAESLPGS